MPADRIGMTDRRPKIGLPDTETKSTRMCGKAGAKGGKDTINVAVQGELFDLSKPRKPWMRPYNGFSWSERCAVTPIQNMAIREGRMGRPTVCSICGYTKPDDLRGVGYVYAHLEDYRKPLKPLPTCKRCHAALHSRFDNPERFIAVAKANWRQGAWFTLLSMDPACQYQPFDVTYPDGL